MPGKLIIPFHFHFHLMCRPYTPNLTTAFNTSQKSEEKTKKQKTGIQVSHFKSDGAGS